MKDYKTVVTVSWLVFSWAHGRDGLTLLSGQLSSSSLYFKSNFYFLSQRGRKCRNPSAQTWNPTDRTARAVFGKSLSPPDECAHAAWTRNKTERRERKKVHFSAFLRIAGPESLDKTRRRLSGVKTQNFFSGGCFIGMLRSFGDALFFTAPTPLFTSLLPLLSLSLSDSPQPPPLSPPSSSLWPDKPSLFKLLRRYLSIQIIECL